MVVGKGGETTKGCHTGDYYDNDSPLALVAVVALSELEAAIPFGLGEKESVTTVSNYNELTFTIFIRASILVLVLIHRCLYRG